MNVFTVVVALALRFLWYKNRHAHAVRKYSLVPECELVFFVYRTERNNQTCRPAAVVFREFFEVFTIQFQLSILGPVLHKNCVERVLFEGQDNTNGWRSKCHALVPTES